MQRSLPPGRRLCLPAWLPGSVPSLPRAWPSHRWPRPAPAARPPRAQRMPPALWGLPSITSLILSDVGLGQRQLAPPPAGYLPGLYELPTGACESTCESRVPWALPARVPLRPRQRGVWPSLGAASCMPPALAPCLPSLCLPAAISRLAPLLRELSLLQHACSTEELAALSTVSRTTDQGGSA